MSDDMRAAEPAALSRMPTPDDPVHRDEHGNAIEDYHVCGCRPAALDVEQLAGAAYTVVGREKATEIFAEYDRLARLQSPDR